MVNCCVFVLSLPRSLSVSLSHGLLLHQLYDYTISLYLSRHLILAVTIVFVTILFIAAGTAKYCKMVSVEFTMLAIDIKYMVADDAATAGDDSNKKWC